MWCRDFALIVLLNVLVCANVDARSDSALINRIKQIPIVQKIGVIKAHAAQKLVAGGMAVLLVCTGISCTEMGEDTEMEAISVDHPHLGASFYLSVDKAADILHVSDYAEFASGEIYEVYDTGDYDHFKYWANYTHELDYDGSVVTRFESKKDGFFVVQALGDYHETWPEPYDYRVYYEHDLTAVLVPPQVGEYTEIYLFTNLDEFGWQYRTYLHGTVVDVYPDDGYALVNVTSRIDHGSNLTSLARPYLLLTRWPTAFESDYNYSGGEHIGVILNGLLLEGERSLSDSDPRTEIWNEEDAR